MTQAEINQYTDPRILRRFTQAVLRDLLALEHMINEGLIETGVRRIGAEQELVLVDRTLQPAPASVELLELIDDDRFTFELGRFNMEFNLDPLDVAPNCLSRMEDDLRAALGKARAAASARDVEIVLTGILPTLRKSDLDLTNLTPVPRYRALNAALKKARGSEFELRLRGTDEISVKHDSVMLESCNTSFQLHFQVGPEEFANLYNIAQVVAAPLMAATCNSPMLFARRLWRETRIAVFEQSIDTRQVTPHVHERRARVSFGNQWVKDSITEIYRDDLTRFRVFLAAEIEEDPFEELAAGRTPRLRALSLQNGTVYRWNRPCYGICEGKPHLRIENRILPSGPTVRDEIANAAFWFGLMAGFARRMPDITERISFDDAKSNFVAAARRGINAQLAWFDGRHSDASTLIARELIPLARWGLDEAGIDSGDINRYLDVIEQRVLTRCTGAGWILKSYANMGETGSRFERMRALVAGMSAREKEGRPVHEWTPASIDEAGAWRHNYERIGQFMTTDLFTVHQDEVIELVASVMAWRKIRHVPVEDDEHKLVGIVTSAALLRYVAEEMPHGVPEPVAVSRIMEPDPVTVTPETPTLEAIEIMRQKGIGCLPVLKDGHLVGIVSEHDFMAIAERLLLESD